MDCDVDKFNEVLPAVMIAIEEADFIAIDTELTGLFSSPSQRHQAFETAQGIFRMHIFHIFNIASRKINKNSTKNTTPKLGTLHNPFPSHNSDFVALNGTAKKENLSAKPSTSIYFLNRSNSLTSALLVKQVDLVNESV